MPTLFRYIKIRIDENRDLNGKWLLTGSQKFHLIKNLQESLAGRISILELDTLSMEEVRDLPQRDQYLFLGGYPELWKNEKLLRDQFFDDYVATYIQRDLPQILNVTDSRSFSRFIRSVALRAGQLTNFSEMIRDVGVSNVTGKRWFESLVASNLCGVLEPFFSNQLKRLVKSPKVYFKDMGFLAYYLGIDSFESMKKSTYCGSFFENFVFCELVRKKALSPAKMEVFFLRDKNNLEIDFVVEAKGSFKLIEVKATEVPDSKKLNFSKIQSAFPKETEKFVACLTPEPFQKEGVSYFNPLNESWPF